MIDFTKDTNGGGSFSSASLALPTGTEALTDPALYSYIKGLYDNGNTILENNYTIVGSPTITEKGIATGISASDYFAIPNFDYSRPFDIIFKFKVSSLENAPIFNYSKSTSTADNQRFGIALTLTNGKIDLAISETGSGWTENKSGTTEIAINTWYWAKLEFTGTTYNVYLSADGVDYTQDLTLTRGAAYSGMTYAKFGTNGMRNAGMSDGTLDLNSITIKVNGKIVFCGNYLTCTQLSTGSKVVGVSNSDIIETIYLSAGSAPYFVIDTVNETVTLPKGDLFGFITQALN